MNIKGRTRTEHKSPAPLHWAIGPPCTERVPVCPQVVESGEQGPLSLFSVWSLIPNPGKMVILEYSSTSSTIVCHTLGDRMGSGRDSGVSPESRP